MAVAYLALDVRQSALAVAQHLGWDGRRDRVEQLERRACRARELDALRNRRRPGRARLLHRCQNPPYPRHLAFSVPGRDLPEADRSFRTGPVRVKLGSWTPEYRRSPGCQRSPPRWSRQVASRVRRKRLHPARLARSSIGCTAQVAMEWKDAAMAR